MSAQFWFIAGMLSGVVASLVAIPLWRATGTFVGRRPQRYALAAGAVATFVASAVLIYLAVGSPKALVGRGAAATAPHPDTRQAGTAGKAQSMEAATASLEARLAREGGSSSDWQLLAQSYEFLGRSQDAQRARARASEASLVSLNTATAASILSAAPVAGTQAVAAAQGATDASGAQAKEELSAGQLAQRLKAHPGDAQGWLALADLYRRKRDYVRARTAFEKVVALQAMSATAWADYADVLGSLAGGSLRGEAGRAIDRALAADAANPKALWLKASLAHEERRYADALADWKALRSVLPADSPDARLVDANIAEAGQLAGLPASTAGSESLAVNVPVGVSGTVSLDSAFAARVNKDATLFIYAKAVDSPGPPLAVMRASTAVWPVSFHLDDSMAMLPSRRLSQFQKVVVEARISRTGQAAPASGDLYVTSEVLRPGDGQKLALIISRQIG